MSAHQYGDNYTLTMMEVHTLSYIEDHPGTSSGELIQYWDKTKGTISQILTKLEKLELIEKRKKDGNAKNLYLYVTAEVSHEKGTAVVTLEKDVDNAVLTKAVEDKDYKVVSVQ